MEDGFEPCAGCKQPEHCGSRWPDDDPTHAGRFRGCFGAKTGTLQVTTCAGKTTTEAPSQMIPGAYEKQKA